MIKADIINEVSKNTGFTKVEVENQLDSIINTIMISLSKGERIDIRGFGSFVGKERPKRLAVNPSTKEKFILNKRYEKWLEIVSTNLKIADKLFIN